MFDFFSSDRSHMMVNGEYVKPPPTWHAPVARKDQFEVKDNEGNVIETEEINKTTNLFSHFVDMKNKKIGTVMTEDQFFTFMTNDFETPK